MATINVLIVADGSRFTFDPKSTTTEGVFSLEFLVQNALTASTDPVFAVATAHRRGQTNGETHVTIPGNFVFTPAALAGVDVLWLMGDEGYNDKYLDPATSDITDDEKIAIANFMAGGGGVFAVGDHDGLGARMCGDIVRVRAMRKWYEAEHPRSGFPSNWSTGAISGAGGETRLLPRMDTLRADSADGQFYFYDQSDPSPQPLTAVPPVHPILQGPNGTISQFPDHMHEGEAIAPGAAFLTTTPVTYNGTTLGMQSFVEFPSTPGHQETPQVIATVTELPGHTTFLPGGGASNVPSDSPPKISGALSAYDGYNAGVGRVLTGSTFHHYLDINLTGDPTTASTAAGVGPTGSNLGLPSAVLDGMRAYYVNAATWLARLPKTYSFWVDKSTFGVDEVRETLVYANAFWMVLDGFRPVDVGGAVPSFSDAFATFVGTMNITSGTPILENAAAPWAPQRILIPCTITFPSSSLASFPTGSSPSFELLTSTIVVGGTPYTTHTVIELVSGADPYFKNIDPATNNVFWLSQDLRVFTLTSSTSPPTVAGVALSTSNPNTLDPTAGYAFIQGLLTQLNLNYTNPSGVDPFASVLPNQSGALSGDSSVTPHAASGAKNYNFAVARVRLSGGPMGSSAPNTRVFFRMFLTQTNDTDFQPSTTYLSSPDGAGRPSSPLADSATDSIPFFASGNYPGTNDYSGLNVNNQNLTAPVASDVWAYFGCFLNVYDVGNVVNNGPVPGWLMGTHHCIVAELAFDGAPIVNSNGVTVSPENSDKLAQRNLQVSPSDNPGPAPTHRVPQTFDLRPSRPLSALAGNLLDQPDELMIDWGNTPVGSAASIYWPQIDAAEVLKLALRMYPTHQLSTADKHTLQCQVTTGATYVPIPAGTGQHIAGLFTVDLPQTVITGEQFKIVVRRISTRAIKDDSPAHAGAAAGTVAGTRNSGSRMTASNWRYVVGTFQVTIPVSTREHLLWPEENTLAIMKWRLSRLAPTNRWHPVLQRYVAYLGAKVSGLGGNPGAILPSPSGVPVVCHPHEGAQSITGKIATIAFDRFGDFEGFCLLSEHGHVNHFVSREHATLDLVRRAWFERDTVIVYFQPEERRIPVSIVLRSPTKRCFH